MSVAAKICGLNSEAAVAAAIEGGAAYLGFVFYPPSPRAVNPARAAELCAAVPAGVRRVGLFVDADDAAIAAVLDAAPIDMLQFPGSESPERIAGNLFGLCRSEQAGRRNAAEITLFKSVGTALEDLAAARLAVGRLGN